MFLRHNKKIVLLASLVLTSSFGSSLRAEDCAGVLPSADCTLDEDTVSPLTIDNGVTLTVGADVEIDQAINGSTNAGDGTVQTNNGGITVNQTADIGDDTPIDELLIGDGDTWTASASIATNNDGADIDLGAGDGGETLNLNNGSSYTGEIDGNAGDVVNIGADGTGGSVRGNGSIQTVTLNVVSGDFETSSGLGDSTALGGLSISNGASLSTSNDIVVGGATDIDGRLSIGSNDSLTTNTYIVDADNAQFLLGVRKLGGATSVGSIDIQNGGPVDLSNDVVSFDVEVGSEPIETQTISSVVSGNTGPTAAPRVNDDLFLYDFSFVQNANDLDLEITRNTLESSTDNSNNLSTAQVLLNDGEGVANAAVQAVQANLNNASSREEFNALLESTQPPANGSTSAAPRMLAGRTNRIIHDRLSAARTNFSSVRTVALNSKRRIIVSDENIKNNSVKVITISNIEPAAGDDVGGQPQIQPVVPNRTRELAERRKRYLKARMRNSDDNVYGYNYEDESVYDDEGGDTGIHVWSEAFVLSADQSEREGLSSYDLGGSGISLGIDSGNIHEKVTLGSAFTYAGTNINGINSDADNETYQLSLYSSYHADNDYYVNGILSYSLTDISNQRSNIGGTNISADSHHDAEQISISGAVGKNIILNKDIFIQPSFQVDYALLEFEGYSEEGGEGLGLTVSENTLNSFSAGPYLKVATKRELKNGARLFPQVGVGYSYDFLRDEVSSTSSFQSFDADDDLNASSVRTKGFDAQAHKIDFDLGLNLEFEKFYGEIDYNLDYQQDLIGHVGSVTAGYRF